MGASTLSRFFKENKTKKEMIQKALTKSLLDENGKPLMWTIKSVDTLKEAEIREKCTIDVQVKGKPNLYQPKLKIDKYTAMLAAASIEVPNLNDKELQDSYGVMTPEDLIQSMIDDFGEYNNFVSFVQEYNGFNRSLQDEVDEVKN